MAGMGVVFGEYEKSGMPGLYNEGQKFGTQKTLRKTTKEHEQRFTKYHNFLFLQT